MTFDTRILPFDAAAIEAAAREIRAGQPVAMPTETVYGLAADATSGQAVARIYQAKGRPSFNPLIVHVVSMTDVDAMAHVSATVRGLAARFWPGPLTMVLPALTASPIASLVTAGLSTVAVRIPAHPAMRALIEAAGRPLAAPSANASGRISPTSAEHVLASLSGRIPLVVDGGPTVHGLESTVVAVDSDQLRLLRPGPIAPETLAECAGLPIERVEGGTIEGPGQLASHYAPSKPLRLNATDRHSGEWLIGFGPITGDETLSATGDLVGAAAMLFAVLHRADATTSASIAVAPIPFFGLGKAINDRLARAAAPR